MRNNKSEIQIRHLNGRENQEAEYPPGGIALISCIGCEFTLLGTSTNECVINIDSCNMSYLPIRFLNNSKKLGIPRLLELPMSLFNYIQPYMIASPVDALNIDRYRENLYSLKWLHVPPLRLGYMEEKKTLIQQWGEEKIIIFTDGSLNRKKTFNGHTAMGFGTVFFPYVEQEDPCT